MEIRVNNIKVPFAGSISLRFFNPLFNDIGSHSFPMSFPARSEIVQKAFGFPGRLEAKKTFDIPARIKSDNIDISGTWQVTSVNESTIEAYFKGNSGSFNNSIAGKMLTDLSYGGPKHPDGDTASREDILAHLTTLMNTSFPDSEYTSFCGYMPNAMGDDTPADMKFINPIEWVNNNISYIIPPSGRLNNGVYLFAGAVLEYIFSEHDYKIEKNVFREDFDLKRLVVFNTYNQNAWLEFDYKNFVPRKPVSDFLKKISEHFNIGFFINEEKRSVIIDKFDNIVREVEETDLKMALQSSDPRTDRGMKFTVEKTDAFNQCDYADISEFPGDISDITVVNSFRNITPSYATLNKIYYVNNEEAYYVISVIDGPIYIATRICSDQLPYIAGDGSVSKPVAAGYPGMYNHRDSFTYEYMGVEHTEFADWLLPRCDLESNFKDGIYDWLTREQPDYNDFPIMFLFARGTQHVDLYHENEIADPAATRVFRMSAPFGTSNVYDATGTYIYSNLALNWRGDYGIIEKVWGNRLNWELNEKTIVKAMLVGNDVHKLYDFSSAKRIDLHNFLVDSFTLELTHKRCRVTEAELLRL